MILEDRKKRRLVADVSDVLIVEEVEAPYESVRPTEEGDERCLVVRNEAGVCHQYLICARWKVGLTKSIPKYCFQMSPCLYSEGSKQDQTCLYCYT